MTTRSPDALTLLRAERSGDAVAAERLFQQLYAELRGIAHNRLRAFRPGDTLDTTALVHEAYLRLVDQTRVELSDRAHFLALASRAMRFVLVDYARARTARKRAGAHEVVPLDDVQIAGDDRAASIIQLDEALQRLRELDGRLATVVEYRFFGGLAYEEIALVTGQSIPTVKRDWTRARTWLHREMTTQ